METLIDAGDAGYSLHINTLVQAQTRTAYWVSGGNVTPGTSSTELTVAVERGEARINDQPVEWAGEELTLAAADAEPRVDVVFARQNSTLGIAAGPPAPYAPDTTADGQPDEPSAFEHWSPAADDGTNVGGVPLAMVLIEPSFASALDIPAENVRQFKIPAASSEEFVYGDGRDNGPTTITTNDADFTLQDETKALPPYLQRDAVEGTFTIGAPHATPTLGTVLDADGFRITGADELQFGADGQQQTSFDSRGGVWTLEDRNPDGVGTPQFDEPLTVTADAIAFGRAPDFGNSGLESVNHVAFEEGSGALLRLSEVTDGTREIWRHADGTASPSEFIGISAPGVGTPFSIENTTAGQDLFRVKTNGQVVAPSGEFVQADGAVASKPFVANTYLPLDGSEFMSGDLSLGTNALTGTGRVVFSGGAAGAEIRVDADNDLIYQDPGGTVTVLASGTA